MCADKKKLPVKKKGLLLSSIHVTIASLVDIVDAVLKDNSRAFALLLERAKDQLKQVSDILV